MSLASFAESMRSGRTLRLSAYRRALKPPASFSIARWSDRFRRLSGVASAEVGAYRTSRTPFLGEIMECLSPDSPVQITVFRKPAQVGATELGNNWVGYFIDLLGGAMLVVLPTVDLAKRWSKQRLAPMLEDTPKLKGKIKEARSRDSGNTLLSKEFVGGLILITGANSAVGLRSMPAQYLFFDEVDAYPDALDEEGHPIEIAWFRSATFGVFRKVLEISTPKVKHASRIDADIEKSDSAYYYVPCPSCQGMQRLSADRLIYSEDQPMDCAGMACEHCGSIMHEGKKTKMLAAGQWFRFDEETNSWLKRPVNGIIAGFSISALYAPIGLGVTWGEIAKLREAAKKDENAARTYTNLVLGESFEEKNEAPQWERLYELRENYKIGTLPVGAYMLVGSADIQANRIEVAWYAFGPDFEGWYIDHQILEGDTASDDVWKQLTVAQKRKFKHAEGTTELPADLFLVDMMYQSEAVKLWVRQQRAPRRVKAISGSESWGAPAVIGRSQTDLTGTGDKKTKRRGFNFWRISTTALKLEVYRRLRRDPPQDTPSPFGGPWLHYPQIADEWFKQLTAERIVRRAVTGSRARSRLMFEKMRPRNEGLDLTGYCLAGAYMLKAEQLTDSEWKKYARRWQNAAPADDSTDAEYVEPKKAKQRPFKRKNFVKDW